MPSSVFIFPENFDAPAIIDTSVLRSKSSAWKIVLEPWKVAFEDIPEIRVSKQSSIAAVTLCLFHAHGLEQINVAIHADNS